MKKFSLVLTLALLTYGAMWAQRSISGTIIDQEGLPLIGASVLVKGTTSGTVSDIDGKYTVEVPEGATTLIFSYTGFSTSELEITSADILDVTLQEGVTLNEAVVTALGISREKKALGYSVQDVKGDDLQVARDPNAINALSGKVAGLQIISSSGNVGSSSRVIIRGASSITGNSEPLFVLNGIPLDNTGFNGNSQYGGVDYGSPVSDINPEDIESITVLKGPNAAALYGSRAANGVILINTKTGKNSKSRLGVSYSGNVGFANPLRLPNYQNLHGQGVGSQFKFVDGTNTAPGNIYDGVDESWGPSFDVSINENDGIDNDGDGQVDESGEGALIDQFHGAQQPWIAHPDNIKNAFETGVTWTNSVAISANAEKMYGRFSFTNMDQKGMAPNTDLKRNSFALSFGMNLSDKLKVDGNANYIRTDSENRPGVGYEGDNILQQSIWAGRQVDWQDLRANWDVPVTLYDGTVAPYNWNHNYQNNPFYTLFNNVKPMNRDRINGFFRATYQLTPWLSLAGRVGNDFYSEFRKRVFGKGTNTYPNGRFEEDFINVNELNMDFLFTARKDLSDKLTIGANVGGNRMSRTISQRGVTVAALTVPGIYTVANADGNPTNTSFDSEKAINSVYGMVSLEYANFLFLDVTGRNDWSSTLPKENNSYFYPSVNLSLALSEVLNLPSFIDFLKLRGTWAQVGSDTDPYKLRVTYAANNSWGGIPSFAVPNELPATELRPEITSSLEFGLDFRMFTNRLGLDFTYYSSETRDQIIGVDASPTTGFTNRVINAGTLANNGVEILLRGTPVRTSSFSWDIELNWAKNNSEVRDLPDGVDAILLGSYWGLRLEAREGEPYGVFRGLKALYNDNGDLVLNDGVPSVDPNGEQILGNITPDWIGGIRNNFSYKGLDLSVLIDMRQGSDIFSMTYMFGRYAGILEESLEGRMTADEVKNGYVYEGVMENGDGTYSPNDVATDAETWNVYYWRGLAGHDRSIFDASYIKLREVSLSYSLPNSLFRNSFIENISLGVYGRNLALISSNVPHIDPESAFTNRNDVQGFEFGQLPTARTIGVRLNANF